MMKKSDFDRMTESYISERNGTVRGPFSHGLGLDTQHIGNLADLIRSDLDQKIYGISWWKNYEPKLDWKRRVLISDHLFKCIGSAEDNAIEAYLHFFEMQDYWEKYSSAMSNSVSYNLKKGLTPNFPPSNALDDINLNLGNAHMAGVFRAVGSVADCLAGIIIGIVGLPLNIKKADLEGVRKYFRKHENKLSEIQNQFFQKLEAQIAEAGPEGWLSWSMQYRNMLVHRARRMQINSQKVMYLPSWSGEPLVDALNNPLVKTETIAHLPANPELSDVEAFIRSEGKGMPLLEESAETTAKGILDSLMMLTNACLQELTEIWNRRKSDPDLIIQPVSQWPDAPSEATEKFVGYKPGSTPLANYRQTISSSQIVHRMRSASLDDENINKWKE